MGRQVLHTSPDGQIYCFVSVRKQAYIWFIEGDELIVRTGYDFHQEQDEIELHKGNWQPFATSDTITEEQADPLVQVLSLGYKNYAKTTRISKDFHWDFFLKTPKESLKSLLVSLGFDPESKVVILKQTTNE